MNWTFSLKLAPGEKIVEHDEERTSFGLKTVHTLILTNRRALFKFNSLSSGLIQSFGYEEIEDVRPANRLMIKYLRLTASGKEYYLNVDDPEEWALKILGYKEQLSGGSPAGQSRTGQDTPEDIAHMLDRLHAAGMLTDEEYAQKLGRLKG